MNQGISDDVIDGALEAIRVEGWGSAKVSILSRVRRRTLRDPRVPPDGFALIGSREFVEATGLEKRRAWDQVEELVDQRVLLRLDGAGSRGHGYRINPDLAEWRVPWRVEAQVAVARAYNPVSYAPQRGKKPRLAPRHSAERGEFVPREIAEQNGATSAISRGTKNPLSRGFVPDDAPQNRGHLRVVSLSSDEDYSSSSVEGEDDEEERQPTDERAALRVIDAIGMRIQGHVFGEPAKRVRTALHGVDDVGSIIEAIRHSTGLGMEGLVSLVEHKARMLDIEDHYRVSKVGGAGTAAKTLAANRARQGFDEEALVHELEALYGSEPQAVAEALDVFRHTRRAQCGETEEA